MAKVKQNQFIQPLTITIKLEPTTGSLALHMSYNGIIRQLGTDQLNQDYPRKIIKYYDTELQILSVKESAGRGDIGFFQAKEGEFAINFSSESDKEKFVKYFNISENHIIKSGIGQESALYFSKNLLNASNSIVINTHYDPLTYKMVHDIDPVVTDKTCITHKNDTLTCTKTGGDLDQSIIDFENVQKACQSKFLLTNYSKNTNSIDVVSSAYKGDTGVYRAGNGEVSINFQTCLERAAFEKSFSLKVGTHVEHYGSVTAMYFVNNSGMQTLHYNQGDVLEIAGSTPELSDY